MLTLYSHLRARTLQRTFQNFQIRPRNYLFRRQICTHQSLCARVSSQMLGGEIESSSTKADGVSKELIPLPPLTQKEEVLQYPTVILQVRKNMLKFENCVLLTRIGGFYELYFEQAEEVGPLLGVKVGQKKTNAGLVSMAGFPFYQLERYLKILVEDQGRYVAIAEEFPNTPSNKIKAGGLLHDRRVTRVITPGTLIDENFMDPLTNNYILAIHIDEQSHLLKSNKSNKSNKPRKPRKPQHSGELNPLPVGLSWLDLSTGHFYTQYTELPILSSILARIGPREIILDQSLKDTGEHDLLTVLGESSQLIAYTDTPNIKSISEWAPMLESPVSTRDTKEFTPMEVSAGSLLLSYLINRLQGSNLKLRPPTRQLNVMDIDRNTIRALEIRKTMSNSTVGSLLHTIRRTETKGGARLLETWLSSPSTCPIIINSRLDIVTYILNNKNLQQKIVMLLRRCHDSHRILQKFAFGRGIPDDLMSLAGTIKATQELVSVLDHDAQGEKCIEVMKSRIQLNGPKKLASCILDSIDEEGIIIRQHIVEDDAEKIQDLAETVVAAEGSHEDMSILRKGTARKKKPKSIREHYIEDAETWIMKPDASPTLTQLHEKLVALKAEKRELEETLCADLGATSLTLRFTAGLGHICHVKGRDIKITPQQVKNVGLSKTTRSFHHPDWTSLGQKIDHCTNHMRIEEQRVLAALREQVIQNIIKLRRNATVLDELDIACSFATLAAEKNWVRPVVNSGTRHKVVAGRHPTVESGLKSEGRGFVTNDCFVGENCRTWFITGPNMAGKSTFLRQNALITVLAQIGSYVPATYAEIGIVDQIFSRIGSADNLYKDQSTFMMEMLEAAYILKHATSRSFVIMDEMGRGTTNDDGEAIAWACLWHLTSVNKCRTLFATHFHNLSDRVVQKGLEGVGMWCTDVIEEQKGTTLNCSFRYVHKLREGVNKKSHALKVARLAGLPEKSIAIAQEVLIEQNIIT
ncbi:DNA mismatch repair protein mutS [Blumeria hordei DH14]|uniref:DNA mismatch repair protein mutS n=1 Tax=Blumeria graminis f. sp. hordei (strain DH14) TaxID=546991 RepID=N1JEI1_BLUG1|nr:DNA mismatch repair protein mutS [Blumeria hordei DH14]